ncbi:TonB-dependent receptor [Thalassolituus sp. LLYu03]|uniref:TonB-dependent receptor n=1 Tax=Thalassolituus sp. LLYu03 TaxID=3421656 RepID=UPI003D2976B1
MKSCWRVAPVTRTESARRWAASGLPWRSVLRLACLLPAAFFLPDSSALAACFYDGVSQTRADHLLGQLNQRYGLAAISDQPPETPIPQPLGDCPADEFLALISANSDWQAVTQNGGVRLTRVARAPVAQAARAPVPEIVVLGLPDGMSRANAARYASNGLSARTDITPAQLSGEGDLTHSLSRQSAIAFSQEAGMDRNISIRGLSSDASRVLVNGMPMLATSASIDARGAVNNSRSFDFNVLPQGLFTQVVVGKSSDARTNEGAIGGSVDLRIPKPLDMANAGLLGQWLSLQAENNLSNGADGAALAAGTVQARDDGSLGWSFGVSLRQRGTQERGFSTVRWQTSDWGEQSALSDDQQADIDGLFHPRHNRYDLLLRDQTTLGASAALQWRDGVWGDIDLSLFGARMHQSMHEYHISSASLKDQDLSSVQVNDYTSDGRGMVYGDFSNVDIRSEHNYEVDETRLGQLTFDWALPLSAVWRLNTSAGLMNSDFDSPVHDKVSLTRYGQDFSYDLRSNSRIAVNHYGFDISDPAGWQLSRITRQQDEVTNRYQVGSLELVADQGQGLRHFFGLQYQGFANQRREADDDTESVSGEYVSGYQLTPGNFGRSLGVSGLPRQWVVGRQSLIRTLGISDTPLTRDPTLQHRLDETTLAGWWQTGFESWRWAWPLRGDVGLRWSGTEQRVRGAWLIDDSAEAVDVSSRNQNWLPSLHLVAHARDDLLLRFGYSRDLSRPSISDLTSAVTLSSPSARLLEGGNNQLRPSRAHAFDLAGEWYGDDGELLALGLFYKRIDSLVVDVLESVSLDQLPYYNPAWASLSDDGLYSYRRPVNGPGTDISGLELTLSSPLRWLPAPFDRLGLDLGYALSHGLVRYPLEEGEVTLPAPELSRHVVSSDLWYQWQRLRAGVTLRARSQYLVQVPGANGNDRVGVNGSAIAGAYLHWQADEQLTLTLEARNLTNEAYDLFVDKTNRVYSYSTTGTELMAGVSLRFGD